VDIGDEDRLSRLLALVGRIIDPDVGPVQDLGKEELSIA
jgi:hypothetical protein